MVLMRILAVLALALTTVANADARGAEARCKPRCYQQKSFEYQRCRLIPPAKREERNACFIRADSTLERCLRGC